MEIIENMMIAAPDELCLFPSVYNYSACRLLRKKGQKRSHFLFEKKNTKSNAKCVVFFPLFNFSLNVFKFLADQKY